MDKLAAYLEEHDVSRREFAEKIGVTEGMVGHYLSGRRVPHLKRAFLIEQVTKGAVPAKEWQGAARCA